jgi:NAD(P)-dependent dehydrogenase (short-subunit alcohol dehydrogenase family)
LYIEQCTTEGWPVQPRFAGKVAVVTGGASGIGAGIARRLVAEGARCLVADLQEEQGRAVVDELGDAAQFVRVDVTDEAAVAGVIDRAVSEHGRLDCLFNNAGVLGAVGSIVDTDRRDWDRSLAVLLTSVFFGIKHGARVMRAQGGGAIVNTASTAGVRAGLGPHAYTAAKHGVVGLTTSAAVELMPSGIRVNAIAPGATVSGMTAGVITGDPTALGQVEERLAKRFGRAAQPEDVAAAAAFLASDEAWYVNGACLVIDAASEVAGEKGRRYFGPDPA